MRLQTFLTLLAVVAAALHSVGAGAQSLDQVLETEKESHRSLARSQQQIDAIQNETDDLVARYRTLVAEIASLETYNGQVESLVAQQEADLANLAEQIDQVAQVKRAVMPLIQDMIDSLREFVAHDLPFRRAERLARIEALQTLMGDPEVTPAERYRLVLERYATEADYGNTLDAWPGEVDLGSGPVGVHFLRVGRVALVLRTQGDDRRSFVWNAADERWQELPGEYDSRIRQAIQMAQQAVRADLVRLPVPAPRERSR